MANKEKKYRPIKLHGIGQRYRMVEAIMPESVQIDERSPSERLNLLTRYAELIQFYNLDNEKDGSWREFLENDPSIFMASIAHAPVQRFSTQFDSIKNLATGSSGSGVDRPHFDKLEFLVYWSERVTNWYYQCHELREKEMVAEIKNAVDDQLFHTFDALFHVLSSAELNPEQQGLLSRFQNLRKDSLWNPEGREVLPLMGATDLLDEDGYASASTQSNQFSSEQFYDALKIYFKALKNITSKAEELFELTLKRSDHQPHSAMIIAFVKLFEHSKKALNSIGKRHLDFYYREVLGLHPRQGSPDQVFLHMQPTKNVSTTFVKKRTELLAGKWENGRDIAFATDHSLVVTQAKVTAYKTLFLETSSVSLDDENEFISVDGIYCSVAANSQDGKGAPLLNPEGGWPAFGAPQLGKGPAYRTMADAEVGYWLCSPDFYLAQGERSVQVRFYFESLKNSLGKDIGALITAFAKANKLSEGAALYRLFVGAFEVSITTKKGWMNLPSAATWFDKEQCCLNLHIKLETGDAPWEVTPKGVSPELNELKWPGLKVLLNPKHPWYAFSYVNGLKLKEAKIDVTVEGIKSFVLYNQAGQLPVDKPFQPFGAVAKEGDYLLVGNSEMFCKRVNGLSLEVEWQGLPKDDGGFEGYFEAYGQGVENEDFTARLSVLSDGFWRPTEEGKQQELELFECEEVGTPYGPETRLKKTTAWNDIDMSRLSFNPDEHPQHPLKYTPYTPTGFFKLELSGPDMGFGGDIYAEVLAETTIQNARKKEDNPLPKKPFIPTISKLSLGYTSSTTLDFSPEYNVSDLGGFRAELYHISPFGRRLVNADGIDRSRHLMPTIEQGGYLFLALEDIEHTDRLTLLIHISNDTVDLPARQPRLQWECLKDNIWTTFSKQSIESDTTNGFLNTGIVVLRLPKGMTDENDIMPKGKYWIRVRQFLAPAKAPHMIGVYTQAVKATWVRDEESLVRLETPLAPGSLKKPAGKFPDIKKIIQPVASHGGIPVEKEPEFYTRVSERLRHRARALTTWDTQRMVLERFPDVYAVKATNADENMNLTPGSVNVTVLSNVNWNSRLLPRVKLSTLFEIERFLAENSSPFMDLRVSNAIYETLLVNCKVMFSDPDQEGYFTKKLNTDIFRYISPWVQNLGLKEMIGAEVDTAAILSYIESLPYVTYVTGFSVEKIAKRGDHYELDDSADNKMFGSTLDATGTDSVFVSAAQHRIEMLTVENFEDPVVAGIGRVVIGEDFIVRENRKIVDQDTSTPDVVDDGEGDYHLIVIEPD